VALPEPGEWGKAYSRSMKRRRKAERREWRMARAVRFSLYVGPIAALLTALALLFK
jgi:hypothetical protein